MDYGVIEQIKRYDADRATIEEMLELSALGGAVVAEYEKFGVPVPDTLTDALAALRKGIIEKRRDAIQKALKVAKTRKEALKTQEEKRKDTEAEIEKLQKMLDG